MNQISKYHAHFYFNQDTVQTAKEIYLKSEVLNDTFRGRFNERNVGPHTLWSFMIGFDSSQLNEVIPWLTLNRAGLTVLIHPVTDNDLKDHTEHAMWLGEPIDLNTSILV